ncbi:hypothetical protein HBI73_146110 [Parastagonospora nodorum]|nr:hypothetical protein HBI04_167660 [Parastagonospora nodorum]KAH4734693.1 hypothetical protein HBH78_011690 [Parastagonospora nodorum]KAH4865292.1 hypothetical protein HBH59_164960 [Parastagonospora nodorum]KAH4926533.1 hypothetical protein HBI79_144930 [Parastagonospora nodorum]KAH5087484.1 hypothetical protein HBI73_146110 [Parastagonospora nodorum]
MEIESCCRSENSQALRPVVPPHVLDGAWCLQHSGALDRKCSSAHPTHRNLHNAATRPFIMLHGTWR